MTGVIKHGIGWDLLRVHKVITRSLDLIIVKSQEFTEAGFPDAITQAGFTDYVRCLASFLHAHHTTEEELTFPYFRVKLPDAPYDAMLSEHSQMAWLVYDIRSMVGDPDGASLDPAKLKNLESVVIDVRQIWRQHIPKEENSFSPQNLDQVISPDEQKTIGRSFAEHSARHAVPDYLVTAFLLMNLEGEDREALAQNMPPQVIKQLVPVLWKDKWEPMRPFLLP
jgi:hemerythrin-like domain-containing protein